MRASALFHSPPRTTVTHFLELCADSFDGISGISPRSCALWEPGDDQHTGLSVQPHNRSSPKKCTLIVDCPHRGLEKGNGAGNRRSHNMRSTVPSSMISETFARDVSLDVPWSHSIFYERWRKMPSNHCSTIFPLNIWLHSLTGVVGRRFLMYTMGALILR